MGEGSSMVQPNLISYWKLSRVTGTETTKESSAGEDHHCIHLPWKPFAGIALG